MFQRPFTGRHTSTAVYAKSRPPMRPIPHNTNRTGVAILVHGELVAGAIPVRTGRVEVIVLDGGLTARALEGRPAIILAAPGCEAAENRT